MAVPGTERHIPERDWKLFRELHPILVDRYCQRVLDKSSSLIGDGIARAHERYLRLHKHIQSSDKELGWAFDDMRRSTAREKIAAMRVLGLLTDDEMRRFSEETQRSVETLSAIMR